MINSKYIKLSISAFVAVFILWVATPKVFFSELFHFNSNSVFKNAETTIESNAPETNDFDGEEKPVYFNIFKFVNNFIPVKQQN